MTEVMEEMVQTRENNAGFCEVRRAGRHRRGATGRLGRQVREGAVIGKARAVLKENGRAWPRKRLGEQEQAA